MTGARRCGRILVVVLALALGGAQAAQATTYTVTNTEEFVAAVGNANASPGADTIQLNHTAGTAYLPKTKVVISGDLTINGSSVFGKFAGTSVAPFPSDFFTINAGVTATFRGVTITGGGGSGGFSGINVLGSLILENSTVAGNGGPGVTVNPGATAVIRNSTLSDGLDFGLIAQGTVDVFNSTIANNSNGGLDPSGTVHLTNTIVAKNGFADCTVPVASSVKSLASDNSCFTGGLSSTDPQFSGNLTTANGGPTPTLALKPASPAIDAGTNTPCPTTDQRGQPRNDGKCDIGAYEAATTDTTPPVITVPPDITQEATSSSGAAVSYTVSATDNKDPSVAVSCSPASGSTFPLGATTVTCTATDASNNTATKTFKVTVSDTKPPTFQNVPADITKPATGPSGAVVAYTAPTATDAVSGTVAVTCAPASGSTFPVGTTTVTCTAKDAANNTGTATFKVTVTAPGDSTPPTLHVPADMSVEATSASGAPVGYTVTVTDPDDAASFACSPPPGATFPLGTTTVNCTATDSHANTSTASFKVTVKDTTAPALQNVPADISAAATGPSGVTVDYTPPTATDAVSGNVPVTCAPASGSNFPIGTTTVTCTATDAANNAASASFKVTVAVVDKTAPTITTQGNLIREASGPSGAAVAYVVTATDPDDAATMACSPESGSTFPIGQTMVTCGAVDSSSQKNRSEATFTITVRDTTGPALRGVPADITAGPGDASGIAVSYALPTAVDAVDGAVPVACTPASGAKLPVGTTVVTCTAKDRTGNATSGTFNVKVSAPPPVAAQSTQSPRPLSKDAEKRSALVDLIVAVRSSKSPAATRRSLRTLLSRALTGGFGSPGGFAHGCALIRKFVTATSHASNRKKLDAQLAKGWIDAAESIYTGAGCNA